MRSIFFFFENLESPVKAKNSKFYEQKYPQPPGFVNSKLTNPTMLLAEYLSVEVTYEKFSKPSTYQVSVY